MIKYDHRGEPIHDSIVEYMAENKWITTKNKALEYRITELEAENKRKEDGWTEDVKTMTSLWTTISELEAERDALKDKYDALQRYSDFGEEKFGQMWNDNRKLKDINKELVEALKECSDFENPILYSELENREKLYRALIAKAEAQNG